MYDRYLLDVGKINFYMKAYGSKVFKCLALVENDVFKHY